MVELAYVSFDMVIHLLKPEARCQLLVLSYNPKHSSVSFLQHKKRALKSPFFVVMGENRNKGEKDG